MARSKLLKRRQEVGISRPELARKSGHAYALITRLELRYCYPSDKTARDVARVLKTEPSKLWPEKFGVKSKSPTK